MVRSLRLFAAISLLLIRGSCSQELPDLPNYFSGYVETIAVVDGPYGGLFHNISRVSGWRRELYRTGIAGRGQTGSTSQIQAAAI